MPVFRVVEIEFNFGDADPEVLFDRMQEDLPLRLWDEDRLLGPGWDTKTRLMLITLTEGAFEDRPGVVQWVRDQGFKPIERTAWI